jgi:hypothetical protein
VIVISRDVFSASTSSSPRSPGSISSWLAMNDENVVPEMPQDVQSAFRPMAIEEV